MKTLHDRINDVINTCAFEESLEADKIDLFEFQASWHELSKGKFENLPGEYQRAVLAGEGELQESGELALVAA